MSICYIDPSWSGTATGEFATPLRSWGDVHWVPRAEYRQKAGTTWTGPLVAGAPNVTIGAYDPAIGAPTKDKATISGVGTTRPVTVSGFAGVTVEDLDIIGGTLGANRRCVGAYAADGLILRRLACHDVPSDGLTDCDGIFVTGNDVTIDSCTVHDVADDGIWLQGLRATIIANTVTRVALSGRVAGDCIQIYGGVAGDQASGLYIADNYLDHSDRAVKQGITVGALASRGGTIERNTIVGPAPTLDGFAGILVDMPGLLIQYNDILNGRTGITLLGAASAIGNTIVGAKVGIELSTGAAGARAAQNTIIGTLDYAIWNQYPASTAEVTANVIRNCAKGVATTAVVIVAGNRYFGVPGVLEKRL